MLKNRIKEFHFIFKEKISRLPKTPGVYSLNGARRILYIGKAVNLRARVKNHFSQPTWQDNHFVNQTTHIGYIETGSEIEALLLESQLIKKHQPRYNIMLRDDKQYFYVCFTGDKLPCLVITHQPLAGNSPPIPLSYFKRGGTAIGIKSNSDVSMRPLPLKVRGRAGGGSYDCVAGPFTDGKSLRLVLRYLRKIFPYYTQKHRKLPCSYCHINLCPGPNPDIHEYKKNIAKIKAVLNGKKPRVLSALKKEMAQLSKAQDFEKAARVRDQIKALENIFSHKSQAIMTNDQSNPKPQHPNRLGFKALGFDWSLGFSHWGFKSLEAYDISNIQGREPVASMIRFSAQGGPASGGDWKPDKSMYRRFRIRLPEKPDDYAMMREVIRRRLRHLEWPYPDVFLIDGGRGQLNAALKEIKDLIPPPLSLPLLKGEKRLIPPLKKGGLGGVIKVIALAKRFNELYIPNRKKPIPLDSLPHETKNLLMYARDEAHRFAIHYHRKLHRRKNVL